MSFFAFGIYFCLLSHCVRLHLEMHSVYSMFSYTLQYDESLNGIRIILELFKIQLFIGIGSCVHDSWAFASDTFLLQQSRLNDKNNQIEYRTLDEDGNVIE